MSMSAGCGHQKRPSKVDNSNSHMGLHYRMPKQSTLSAISDLAEVELRGGLVPLSDTEADFEQAQSESSDTLSSNGSQRENQRREIRRLRLEVAALKLQQERSVLSESLRAEKMRELRKKYEADDSCSKALIAELGKTKAIHDRLKEHLQCQICLEMLQSPWTLSPCGHVGCLECLMSWFITTGVDDDPEDPTEVFYRPKTCPQCRAAIESPPTPSYILKNLVNEFQSDGSTTGSMNPAATDINTADPWAGIFSPLDGWQDDDGDTDTADDRNMDGEDDDSLSSDSPSDSSEYRVEYAARSEHLDQLMEWEIEMREQATAWTEPTWQPPRFISGVTELSTEDRTRLALLSPSEILSLLRRGATIGMIALFKLSYNHQGGITSAYVNGTSIRLGWNLSRSSNDPNGNIFMRAVINELNFHSERFRIGAGPRGEPTFIRLVPSRGGPEGDDEL